jgi:predicted nucleic acid-binding protein
VKYLLDTDLLFVPETPTVTEIDAHLAWREWVKENHSEIGFSSITLIELRLRAAELADAGFSARASLLNRWAICAEIFYRDRIVGISDEITKAARELLRHSRTTGLVPLLPRMPSLRRRPSFVASA